MLHDDPVRFISPFPSFGRRRMRPRSLYAHAGISCALRNAMYSYISYYWWQLGTAVAFPRSAFTRFDSFFMALIDFYLISSM